MPSRLATLEESANVVFSDATALSALNGQHWTDGNGNDVTGRQNSDYLTINNGSTTTTVPMDFVYKDQAALTAALVQNSAHLAML